MQTDYYLCKSKDLKHYSSEFNSIEHVWAAAKSNFVKLCLVNDQPMTRTRFSQSTRHWGSSTHGATYTFKD